jgi:hypothetical protein
MKQFLAAVFLCAPLAAIGSHLAQGCVTLVADLYGAAAVADRPAAKLQDRWPIQLLQCFPAGKTIMLEAGARVTLFFPASGEAVELRGPGRFQLADDGVQPVSSAATPARVQLNAAFRDIKLDRSRLVPAGVRMRAPRPAGGVVLLAPSGIVLAEEALVFRWEPVEGAREYSVRVANSRREVLLEERAQTSEMVVPLGRRLAPGEGLMWQVEALLPAGQERSRWQEFILATPEARILAARIDQELPSPSAAERNLREVLLRQYTVADKGEP